MIKIKRIIVLLPLILTGCGKSVKQLSLDEGRKKLDEIRKHHEAENYDVPKQLVTRKEQKSYSEKFHTIGTYKILCIYDASAPKNIIGYSKETYNNIGDYANATIEKWYLMFDNETKATIISKSNIPDETFDLQFDLTDFGQESNFKFKLNENILNVLHFSYKVANLFADDIKINASGNEYSFFEDEKNFIIDVSNEKDNRIESSHIIYDGCLITKDEYKLEVGGTSIKEYTTTYTLEKQSMPNCISNIVF